MEGYGGPAQPSPTIAECLNGGLGGPAGRSLGRPARVLQSPKAGRYAYANATET
jgi:hypothetical protein